MSASALDASGGNPDRRQLSHRLAQFAHDVAGVQHAVMLAMDGLPIAASDGLDPDTVDKRAATASVLISVADRLGHDAGRGNLVLLNFRTEAMNFLFLYVTPDVGLTVEADPDCNLGHVGHHMQRLRHDLATHLSSAPAPGSTTPVNTDAAKERPCP